jgi:energy-coupling factor transporter ATP-binding protein EcfA2
MKLTIEAFRGANTPCELKINPKRDLTILYGENGAGKTTISDALEFLFYGQPGSLDEKSLDGKSKLPALVHAKRQNKDLKVAWEESNRTRVAKLSGTKAIFTGEVPDTKLRTLRRNLITSLIEETPAKRFERIRDFVELPSLEREESALTDFISTHKQRREAQLSTLARSEDELKTLYDDVFSGIQNPPSMEQWIKDTLAESAETVAEELQILKDLEYHLGRLRNDFKPLEESYQALDVADETFKTESEKFTVVAAKQAGGMAEAIHLLERTAEYLDGRAVDACPVCDTAKTSNELRLAVAEKLTVLKEVSAQNVLLSTARKTRERCSNSLETLQSGFFEIIRNLLLAHKAASDQPAWQIPEIVPSLRTPTAATDLTAKWFAGLRAEAAQLRPLAEWVTAKLSALQKTETHKASLIRIAKSRDSVTKEYGALHKLINKAESIKEVLRSERTRYADSMLLAISEDFARIYAKVHPGENLEQIRLFVHPDRKGSAMLTGAFHGKEDISPVAYFSESHLDTLGLCLFLALEKKYDPSSTLLFLDDAIASVDEAHMERLYEAILEEAAHFKHVLITSHYQPLRFKFKWGQLTKQNVDFIELGAWTLEAGICFQKGCDSQIELLKRRLAEKDDPQAIAAKSGVVLEYLFDFLTGIYRCKLPRLVTAGQGWTLHEYKEALESSKKLMDALKAEHVDASGAVTVEIPLKPLISNLFSQFASRNIFGAHFNALASHFDSQTEAIRLGEAVLELVDALCDADYQLPESNKSGSCWTNRGEKKTRRLHPLMPPQ